MYVVGNPTDQPVLDLKPSVLRGNYGHVKLLHSWGGGSERNFILEFWPRAHCGMIGHGLQTLAHIDGPAATKNITIGAMSLVQGAKKQRYCSNLIHVTHL